MKQPTFYSKLTGAVSVVSVLAMLLTGFNFHNYFMLGAIWTTMHWIVYNESQKKFYLVATIISIILMGIGAFGLFMNA